MRTILVRGSKDCPGGVESFPTFTLDTPNYFWYNQDRRIMRKTDEEKVALKMSQLLSDITLNLDDIGKYYARLEPSYHIKRLYVIAGAAEEELEKDERQIDTLF